MFKKAKLVWIDFWTQYWDKKYTQSGQRPKKVITEVIDHKNQRYNTVGDYYYNSTGTLLIFVSDLGDWRFNYLVSYHEPSEIPLCWYAGITLKQIDDFDLEYDKNRAPGDTSEPGDDPNAPYYQCHKFASEQERKLADLLDVDWEEYEEQIALVMQGRAESGQDD
jgi:hypothetical protein